MLNQSVYKAGKIIAANQRICEKGRSLGRKKTRNLLKPRLKPEREPPRLSHQPTCQAI
jgi:hypothetical protein